MSAHCTPQAVTGREPPAEHWMGSSVGVPLTGIGLLNTLQLALTEPSPFSAGSLCYYPCRPVATPMIDPGAAAAPAVHITLATQPFIFTITAHGCQHHQYTVRSPDAAAAAAVCTSKMGM
jgi:hypothetical protein